MINKVYLSLGSNLGDREKNIDLAIALLEKRVGSVMAHSSLYITEPSGFKSDHLFFNSACILETTFPPSEVLLLTKVIEIEIGRTSKSINFQYKDRIIDIDILFYNDFIIESEELIIPHPFLQNRLFVLQPLCEIAPNYLHPTLQITVEELLVRLISERK